mmetsp:Transcript_10377/g.5328  ORF Transcript_10377/g.5328 Transcript_10377/m.5328 type:complete len:141 (-) Transcript_10377:115-537(-)
MTLPLPSKQPPTNHRSVEGLHGEPAGQAKVPCVGRGGTHVGGVDPSGKVAPDATTLGHQGGSQFGRDASRQPNLRLVFPNERKPLPLPTKLIHPREPTFHLHQTLRRQPQDTQHVPQTGLLPGVERFVQLGVAVLGLGGV